MAEVNNNNKRSRKLSRKVIEGEKKGRGEQTTRKQYIAMLTWVQMAKNFDLIEGAATKDKKAHRGLQRLQRK